ncbi:RNA-binding protein 26 isoform X1 [Bemisia tabaci]
MSTKMSTIYRGNRRSFECFQPKMNQPMGTSPLKKVGPAVPPKPKKPQPQVPKSYQLSGACEPSYSVPLQTAAPETKRSGTNSGPVYSNILPVTASEPGDNVYSNIEPTMPMQHLYSNLEPYSKTHIIEDPDALKAWLASQVKCMIEADPVALAKYIYALVKKNKPLDELRTKAISQLEVFFKEKTVAFVDTLFHTIATKSYITPVHVANTSPTTLVSATTEIPRDKLPDKPVEKITKSEATSSQKDDLPPRKRRSLSPPPKRWTKSRSRSPRRSVSRSPRKRSTSRNLRPRSRSRSGRLRSKTRSPRPRSRSRSRSNSWERRRYRRSPVRRPPYAQRYRKFSTDRKYYSNRRRSWTRSCSRSPLRSRSRSRSGSYSPKRSTYRHRNPSPLSPLFGKSSHEPKASLDLLSQDFSATSYSEKQRCIDFEEKGFCMRGDMCPFDHGSNPVVLEPSSVPLLPVQQPSVSVNSLEVPGSSPHYNPTSIKTNLSEWVSQKIMSDALLRGESDRGKSKSDVFSRLGPKPVQEEPSKCTLEIMCIPPKLNTITLLFNHFSKFGKVVNIKVNHNDDPGAALVTFSKDHEAAAALRSPAPVMRNRFIKVVMQGEAAVEKVENVPPVTFKTENKFKKELRPFVLRTTNTLDQRRKVIKPPIVKKKKIEAKQITANLLKLKQELLVEQIAKQKLLIQKLEKGSHSAEDRNSILATIKMLDASIKEIRASLASSVSKLKAVSSDLGALNPVDKKAKLAEVKRELLDAELDLFSAQQKGSDKTEVEKRILKLKKEILLLAGGSAPAPVVPRRPVLPKVSSLSVDHRPTKLLVQNFEVENKGAIVTHMSKFGELKIEHEDLTAPSMLISFKAHKEAELALSKTKQFFGEKISVSFHN